MALESVRVYRITSGDNTYPHSGTFTIEDAGALTVDDSNGVGDSLFGDFTHTGGADVPDQDVTQSSVTEISVGDRVDLRYKYTFTGSDGSSGTVFFLARNSQANYGPLMVSDTPLNAGVTYTFGSFNTDGATPYSNLVAPCFTKGTRIDTDRGPVAVEDLRAGMLVRTLDHGFQRLRWVGSKRLDSIDLAVNPKACPVVFEPGSLGAGVPSRRLVVSRQHRMMVRSRIARRMFDTDEVLLPAIKLVGLPGVHVDEGAQEVTYFHLLFDRHEVVYAEDALSESLYAGPNAVAALSPEARAELQGLFPHLLGDLKPMARRAPAQNNAIKRLVARHAANAKPLQEADPRRA